jgi:hypothetical protein
MKQLSKEEFKQNLDQNFYGTENWYKTMLDGITYTDGVKYLIQGGDENENIGVTSYWLVDKIVAMQHEPAIIKEEFQVWILITEDGGAKLTMEDGNYNEIFAEEIPVSDFPLDEIRLFFTNGVIMLPGEY